MQAARALCAEPPLESVTIDDLVNGAGVAKGTFYGHFEHLPDLQAAVADELAQELDDLFQPFRLQLADPIERIAAGCAAFIREALQNPAWGSLVARSAWALPSVASAARANLREDLRLATAKGSSDHAGPGIPGRLRHPASGDASGGRAAPVAFRRAGNGRGDPACARHRLGRGARDRGARF